MSNEIPKERDNDNDNDKDNDNDNKLLKGISIAAENVSIHKEVKNHVSVLCLWVKEELVLKVWVVKLVIAKAVLFKITLAGAKILNTGHLEINANKAKM